MVEGGIWELRAAFVSIATVVVGAGGSSAEDEFEDGLEGRDAGGDDDNVRFDAMILSGVGGILRRGGTWST